MSWHLFPWLVGCIVRPAAPATPAAATLPLITDIRMRECRFDTSGDSGTNLTFFDEHGREVAFSNVDLVDLERLGRDCIATAHAIRSAYAPAPVGAGDNVVMLHSRTALRPPLHLVGGGDAA